MLHAVEDISQTKKRLKIEIPSDVIESERKDYLEKLRATAEIPGFRPGKAPLSLIEKRFGKEVKERVLQKVITEFYGRALEEAGLSPITLPVLNEGFEFKRGSPLNLSFTVEVMPRLDNLNYENISVKDIQVIVDEDDVKDALKRLAEERAIYEVAEKEIGTGDLVTIDVVDCEIVGGETPPSVKEEVSKIGKEILPPEVIEKLIGKKKGETVEFTTTLDKWITLKELRGKTAKIKCTIKEIKQKTLPLIDDEFAKDLGFKNLSELEEVTKEKVYKAKKEVAERIQKAEILNKIIESNDFEVPETLLKWELASIMAYEQPSEESSNEDVEAKLKQKALKNAKAFIVINAIGKKEGITVTDGEINEKIFSIAQKLQATPEAVKKLYMLKDGSLEGLRQSIFEEKVLNMLLSKATIEKVQ